MLNSNFLPEAQWDMANLGRLEQVNLREVWQTEDGSFTPWLAEENNGNYILKYRRHVRYTSAVPECNMVLHGPWDGGRCTAKGVAVGHPNDP